MNKNCTYIHKKPHIPIMGGKGLTDFVLLIFGFLLSLPVGWRENRCNIKL